MKKFVIVILFLVVTIVSSTPIQRDEDYYEDSDEIILRAVPIVSSEKVNVKRNAPHHYDEMRPRRQQQSGRQQFYNMLIDILATMQSSTKNDIRRAMKRELEKESRHIAER